MNERILVTGGVVFIGSHLVVELLNRNMLVTVIDNLSFSRKNALALDNPNLSFSNIDITNYISLSRVFNEIMMSTIIHIAALHYIPYCNENPLETMKSNILGARNDLTCASKSETQNFFFDSSATFYAPSDDIGRLANAIIRLLYDRITAKKLGNNARNWVE